MKYKYNKKWFIFQYVFVIVSQLLLITIYFTKHLYKDNGKMFLIVLPCVVLFMLFVSRNEYLERYIEFEDENVKFNSFRIAKAGKVMSFNFRYENITSIEASVLPVIGIWKINVIAKGHKYSVPISFCFNKYVELYKRLCYEVKKYNPSAYIDDRI